MHKSTPLSGSDDAHAGARDDLERRPIAAGNTRQIRANSAHRFSASNGPAERTSKKEVTRRGT